MKFIKTSAIGLAALSTPAYADNLIEGVPAGWRLQNYLSASDVTTWYTGSACTNGLLSFPSGTTADVKNRWWSLILSAKISGKSVGVFYETVSGNCNITSFYAI